MFTSLAAYSNRGPAEEDPRGDEWYFGVYMHIPHVQSHLEHATGPLVKTRGQNGYRSHRWCGKARDSKQLFWWKIVTFNNQPISGDTGANLLLVLPFYKASMFVAFWILPPVSDSDMPGSKHSYTPKRLSLLSQMVILDVKKVSKLIPCEWLHDYPHIKVYDMCIYVCIYIYT